MANLLFMYVHATDDDVYTCGITVTSKIWKDKDVYIDIHTKYNGTVSWYIKRSAGSPSVSRLFDPQMLKRN